MRVNFTKIKTISISMLLMLLSITTFAQTQSPLDIALRHLEEKKAEWKLTDSDISDLVISSSFVSTPSDATMIYLIQRHEGVKIFNAIYNITISKEGKVIYAGNRIVADIASKANSATPSLTPEQAIQSALISLEVEVADAFVQKERKNSQEFIFEKGTYSKEEIPVNLQFFPNKEEVRLVWEVSIYLTEKNEAWNLKVDAATGKILKQIPLIIKCNFGDHANHSHSTSCQSSANTKTSISQNEIPVTEALANPALLGGSYNVYAELDANGNLHPHESPIHGTRNLLTGIENTTASPNGWHDENGAPGAEYFITRGNNVHAYLDLDGSNDSQGDEPDGGAELLFDFPLDINSEPTTFEPAAVTNAFFMVNFMHDFSYMYGFDEVAGNYQADNYGNSGADNDHVRVHVHDGSGSNNADFNITADGQNGTMQMYLWSSGGGLLTVDAPNDIAGVYNTIYGFGLGWGGSITEVPLSGEVAVVDDGSLDPSAGCNEIVNVSEITGKFAIVDRGLCEFGEKAYNAQVAGAIGVIICNYQDNLPPLGGGAFGGMVSIPVIGISSGDCNLIRGFIGNGLNISFVQPANSGPEFVSGALDNGIIAHEFGHGISIRLTGGADQPFCLSNGEQMGEGISDFFSLVTTVKEGDTPEMPRGIGTFVRHEETDGRGIRRFPYSTDMSVNPLTYKDIVGQGQHARGEVWTLALWEMYWLLVAEYGFDPDLLEGTGGNNIAVQLMMEGMKISPCGPGYVDGRDAIFAADVALYDGIHECLIWEAFAKRGLGQFAKQNEAGNGSDGLEDFTRPGLCLKNIQIEKTVTDIVEAGGVIDVSLDVVNYKDNSVANVVVTDEIPAGTTVVPGSASNGGEVMGNTIVFDLESVASLQEIEITYQLQTDPTIFSEIQFLDDVENEGENWDLEIIEGANAWNIREDSIAYSGENAWYIQDVGEPSQQTFFTLQPIPVSGTQPVLRFYHWFDTEYAADGGMVEISTDGIIYEQIGEHMFREGYPRQLSYFTFVIPFLEAFSGESFLASGNEDEFIATYVDLTNYVGEDIYLRFRFGTDDEVSGKGWFVDDIEVMDMKNYEGQACLTSDDGDDICAIGVPRGTIVQSEGLVSSKDLFDTTMDVKVFPNPAGDILNLHVENDKNLDANVRILTVDGKEVLSKAFRTSNGLETMTLNVANLAAGFYFVKVSTDEGIVVEKVTIK